MLARVISETLNVRSNPSASRSNIVGQLVREQVIDIKRDAPGAPRWVVIDFQGHERFIARRYLAQSPDKPVLKLDPNLDGLVAEVIAKATQKYDGITYRLGCKSKASGRDSLIFSGTDIAGAPCSGTTVDCSGWVSGLFQLVVANVEAETGRNVFTSGDVGLLSNHSDGQVFGVGKATGQIYSGTDIDGISLRSGLLFGLNNGDYDWEGEDRVFEADHIVMGVTINGIYHITQSSSSGSGVNLVGWKTWRTSMASRFTDFRVHCVDPLATGDLPPIGGGIEMSPALGRPDGDDPLRAPAG
jgi:hypothetical protein